jgi:hypothetical protein
VLARPRRPRPAGAAGPYRVSVSCMQCLECEWDPVNVAFFVHLLLIKATLSHRAHRGTYRSRSMSHGPCVSLLLLSSIVLSYFYSTAGRDSSKRLAPSPQLGSQLDVYHTQLQLLASPPWPMLSAHTPGCTRATASYVSHLSYEQAPSGSAQTHAQTALERRPPSRLRRGRGAAAA